MNNDESNIPTHDRYTIKAEGIELETVVVHHPLAGTDNSDLTIGKSVHFIMKSALAVVFLSTVAFASHGIVHRHRCTSEPDTSSTSTNGGWGQAHSGTASFTEYSGCGTPANVLSQRAV